MTSKCRYVRSALSISATSYVGAAKPATSMTRLHESKNTSGAVSHTSTRGCTSVSAMVISRSVAGALSVATEVRVCWGAISMPARRASSAITRACGGGS